MNKKYTPPEPWSSDETVGIVQSGRVCTLKCNKPPQALLRWLERKYKKKKKKKKVNKIKRIIMAARKIDRFERMWHFWQVTNRFRDDKETQRHVLILYCITYFLVILAVSIKGRRTKDLFISVQPLQ